MWYAKYFTIDIVCLNWELIVNIMQDANILNIPIDRLYNSKFNAWCAYDGYMIDRVH